MSSESREYYSVFLEGKRKGEGEEKRRREVEGEGGRSPLGVLWARVLAEVRFGGVRDLFGENSFLSAIVFASFPFRP